MIDDEQAFLPEHEDALVMLKYVPRLELLPVNKVPQINHEGLIMANNNHVMLQLLLYGGQEVTNRITFFVNHQPVQVNGVDFVEVKLTSGQMALVMVELMLDDLEHFNSLYAVMMATGDGYRLQDNMFKTPTLLLVNE